MLVPWSKKTREIDLWVNIGDSWVRKENWVNITSDVLLLLLCCAMQWPWPWPSSFYVSIVYLFSSQLEKCLQQQLSRLHANLLCYHWTLNWLWSLHNSNRLFTVSTLTLASKLPQASSVEITFLFQFKQNVVQNNVKVSLQ